MGVIIKAITSISQFLHSLNELILATTHMIEELTKLQQTVKKLKEVWNKRKHQK